MENNKSGAHSSEELNPLKIENVKERREYYKEKTKTKSCDNLNPDEKASLASDKVVHELGAKYSPNDYGSISKFELVSKIYELPLSPSVITLRNCQDSQEVRNRIKEI